MVCLPLVEYLPVTDTAAPSTMVSPSTLALAAPPARHKLAAIAAKASGFSFANMASNLPFVSRMSFVGTFLSGSCGPKDIASGMQSHPWEASRPGITCRDMNRWDEA